MSARDHSGVIAELVAGTWRDPGTGMIQRIPIKNIVIADSLEGREAALVREQHPGKSLMIVSDERTREALGKRVYEALKPGSGVREYVWQNPHCTETGVRELMSETKDAEVLIAIGSGTLNDSVKYGTFLTGRQYSVFPTSPMNAYTTPTASVSDHGVKKSITCHSAKGVFFDLEILAKCPKRLVAAAFADVVCRTTSQVDWLLSHRLLGTPYQDTAYTLLAYDEAPMLDRAGQIAAGDAETLAMLTRSAAIMGLGTSFTGTTHSGSMAEHLISHFIDMFAGKDHPGTSHGEQVGVATLTISKLQNQILAEKEPPLVTATRVPEEELRAQFGSVAEKMIEQTKKKAISASQAEELNRLLAEKWAEIRAGLKAVALPYNRLFQAMKAAGCQLFGTDLGLKAEFYQDAVRYARFVRDRYSILDLADDSGRLSGFVEGGC